MLSGKKQRMPAFLARLSYINTILTMIEVWQDSQVWREGEGNMVCTEGEAWRKLLESNTKEKKVFRGKNEKKCLVFMLNCLP